MLPNKIYHGDCLEVMRQWQDECIDMVVTSPPYWGGLRDYGVEGQLGLEKTPEEYLEKMVEVLREIRRVLRPWGTVWLNMGDCHFGSWGGYVAPDGDKRRSGTGSHWHRRAYEDTGFTQKPPTAGAHPVLKKAELCGIPGRLVLALQADGWWRKSDIIWQKLASMPESVSGWRWEQHRVKVEGKRKKALQDRNRGSGAFREGRHGEGKPEWKDCPGCSKCKKHNGLVFRKGAGRPMVSYDYIFLLAKSREYFYDTEAVRTSYSKETLPRYRRATGHHKYVGKPEAAGGGAGNQPRPSDKSRELPHSGANLRNVWAMPTARYPDAHYATFPEELPRRCILAGTSAKGNCAKCRMPWVRILEGKGEGAFNVRIRDEKTGRSGKKTMGAHASAEEVASYDEKGYGGEGKRTVGWLPSCECGAGTVRPIVLDPFGGSGTTGMVAAELGRDFALIELNESYIEGQAKLRTGLATSEEIVAQRPLFAKPE